MKIIEEKFLKEQVSSLNKYVKESSSYDDFFNGVDGAMKSSLQNLSFESDISFFNEVGFILSVITTIISHPHLLNKREEIIVRTELANHVSFEMFAKTMKDSRLWKEDESYHMVPESIYYYQHIDELKIYENIFIVNVIKLIEQELNKYLDFYVSTLLTFTNQDSLSLDNDNSDVALKRLKILINRVKHIKNTNFYKTVNQGGTKLSSIHPTNILLKDRLYNYCYKFYKKMVTYQDDSELLKDIKAFYYILLIKTLKKSNYTPLDNIVPVKNKKFNITKAIFSNDDFIIEIDDATVNGLKVKVINKNVSEDQYNSSTSLLLFESEATFKDEYVVNEKYDSVSVVSLWNMVDVNNTSSPIYQNVLLEEKLIENFIANKTHCVLSSKDIYSVYCPSCKSNNVDMVASHFYCSNCNSKYAFFTKNKKDHLWFITLRRENNG